MPRYDASGLRVEREVGTKPEQPPGFALQLIARQGGGSDRAQAEGKLDPLAGNGPIKSSNAKGARDGQHESLTEDKEAGPKGPHGIRAGGGAGKDRGIDLHGPTAPPYRSPYRSHHLGHRPDVREVWHSSEGLRSSQCIGMARLSLSATASASRLCLPPRATSLRSSERLLPSRHPPLTCSPPFTLYSPCWRYPRSDLSDPCPFPMLLPPYTSLPIPPLVLFLLPAPPIPYPLTIW